MDKIPVGIQLLIDNTSFEKIDTWGVSGDIAARVNELAGENSSAKDKEQAFKKAMIEQMELDIDG